MHAASVCIHCGMVRRLLAAMLGHRTRLHALCNLLCWAQSCYYTGKYRIFPGLHAELQIAWEYSSRFPHLKRCTLQCFSDEISIYPNQQYYRYSQIIRKQLFVNNPTPLSYFQFIVIIALDIWPTKMIITVSTSFCRVHLTATVHITVKPLLWWVQGQLYSLPQIATWTQCHEYNPWTPTGVLRKLSNLIFNQKIFF